MALAYGQPLIFHSDQGSQYAAWMHTHILTRTGVHISMSDKGKPMQNGIAEHFMRTLKEEHVDYADFQETLKRSNKSAPGSRLSTIPSVSILHSIM
jgi:transposase InsO family protein